jgi:hypothetical protein
LTPSQAKRHAHIFTGYGEFFHMIDTMGEKVESDEAQEEGEEISL